MKIPSPRPFWDASRDHEGKILNLRRAKAVLETYVSAGAAPGVQYSVVDAGGTVYEFAGGLADIRSGTPMRRDTTLMAYSMTKTVTAAAVLKLVEAGDTALDAPIKNYLPEFPYGGTVLVRHLLAQTSGLPNPIPLRWVHRIDEHAGFDEGKALDRIARENPRLSFKPGSGHAYSNLSYWYLGKLISRVSGIPYPEFVKKKVFVPLGITDTEASFDILTPAIHAKGYLKKWSFMNLAKPLVTDRKFWGGYENGWLEIRPHYPDGPAFGGIIGSAAGFGKFLRDQLREDPVSLGKAARTLFFEQQRTTDSRSVPMTLGWHIGELDGTPYYYKEGGGAGFHAEMRVYPTRRIASVILTNSTGFDTRRSLSKVDAVSFASIG